MIESCPKCRNLSELYRYPFGADEEPICYRCNCGIRSYCSSMFDYGFSYPHPNDKQTKKKYYLTVRIKLRDEIEKKDKEINLMKEVFTFVYKNQFDVPEYMVATEILKKEKKE